MYMHVHTRVITLPEARWKDISLDVQEWHAQYLLEGAKQPDPGQVHIQCPVQTLAKFKPGIVEHLYQGLVLRAVTGKLLPQGLDSALLQSLQHQDVLVRVLDVETSYDVTIQLIPLIIIIHKITIHRKLYGGDLSIMNQW